MLFKNNPGKEENTHRGSETKFPWWYFLHTGGLLVGQWGAASREDDSYRLHKDISLCLSFCLIFPHFQSLLLSLPLPLLTSPAPPNLFPSCTPHSAAPSVWFNSFTVYLCFGHLHPHSVWIHITTHDLYLQLITTCFLFQWGDTCDWWKNPLNTWLGNTDKFKIFDQIPQCWYCTNIVGMTISAFTKY